MVGMCAQTCEDEFKPAEPLLPTQLMGKVNSSSEHKIHRIIHKHKHCRKMHRLK